MPKIIENLELRLLQEAGEQLSRRGYSAMTIRSVAAACGVGVGTVYNYFHSKEELVARLMLEDWNRCIAAIRQAQETARTPEPVARCIYEQLRAYSARNQAVFRDTAAISGFVGSFSRYHGMLRRQLAEPLRRFCGGEFAAEFIAEALLGWTMAGKDFDEIYGMIQKLF